MTEYIDKEDAIRTIVSVAVKYQPDPKPIALMIHRINTLPPTDVAPVRRGRWMKEHLSSTSGGFYAVVRCSECRSQFPTIYKTRYCPNCGAKMDGDEK